MNIKTEIASKLSPEYPILGMLMQKPAYGYELFQELTVLRNTWHFSLGQIYNILNRMESIGYVSTRDINQHRLPVKRYFEITNKGKEHFVEWLKQTTPCSVRAIRIEFSTRIYYAQKLYPSMVDSIFTDQIDEVHAIVNSLKKDLTQIATSKLFNHMNLDFRIRQMVSVLDWLNDYRMKFTQASK